MPPPRRTEKRSVWLLNPSVATGLDSTVAGARTVAGVDATLFVTGAGAFVAGLCAVTAFEVADSVAGFCDVIAVEFAGLVAGAEAGWVVVSGSFGKGARDSDGNAFATDGISTLAEFVVRGPGGLSFFVRGSVDSIVF